MHGEDGSVCTLVDNKSPDIQIPVSKGKTDTGNKKCCFQKFEGLQKKSPPKKGLKDLRHLHDDAFAHGLRPRFWSQRK